MKRDDTWKGRHEAPKTWDLSPSTLLKLSEQLKRDQATKGKKPLVPIYQNYEEKMRE